MKKIVLTLSIIGTVTFCSCTGNADANATTYDVIQQEEIVVDVTVEQFKNLLIEQGGTILDVRTPEEWAEGIIAKAEKIDYYSDDFSAEVEKLDKKQPIFVYCKKGGRSSSAADILKEKGFVKIYNLDGGITAWIDSGNEIVK